MASLDLYTGPVPQFKGGFEASFEEMLNRSGPRQMKGGSSKGGARYMTGPFKGMTLSEAYAAWRDVYRQMPDQERQRWEREADMLDVRSQRELARMGQWPAKQDGAKSALNFVTAAQEREQAQRDNEIGVGNSFESKDFSLRAIAPEFLGLSFSGKPTEGVSGGLSFKNAPSPDDFKAPLRFDESAPTTKLNAQEQAATGMKYLGRFTDTGKELYEDTRQSMTDLGGAGSYQRATINPDKSVTRESYRADSGTYTIMNTNAQTGANAGTIQTAKGGGGFGFSGRFEDLSPAQQASMIAAGYVHDPSKSGTINGKPAAQAIAELEKENDELAGIMRDEGKTKETPYAGPVPPQKPNSLQTGAATGVETPGAAVKKGKRSFAM